MPKLTFTIQDQRPQANWCWAAVSASISDYFGAPAGPSGGPWQKCEVAQAVLGKANCCQNPTPESCDLDSDLTVGLAQVGHSAGDAVHGLPPGLFAYVKQEIDAKRPVVLRIGWYANPENGHFICLSGYDDSSGSQLVDVEDPYYGRLPSFDFTQLLIAYHNGAGGWTDTYPIS
jgi:hypothetical protein